MGAARIEVFTLKGVAHAICKDIRYWPQYYVLWDASDLAEPLHPTRQPDYLNHPAQQSLAQTHYQTKKCISPACIVI
jgi:hypothetical protein